MEHMWKLNYKGEEIMKNYVIMVTLAFLGVLCLIGCITAHFYKQYEEMSKKYEELQEQNDELRGDIHSVSDAIYIYEASNTDALEDLKDEIHNLNYTLDELKLDSADEEENVKEEATTESKIKSDNDELVVCIPEAERLRKQEVELSELTASNPETLIFSKQVGDENTPGAIKEEPVKFAVYEEDVPAVTPPAEQHLTKSGGVFYFGDQKETYYNLDMSTIVSIAHANGISGEYWVRDDGCKMLGDYIMLACNRNIHPYGTLVETSLGTGISLDTGGFAAGNPYQVDIATAW